jgi:suppressor of ftsI
MLEWLDTVNVPWGGTADLNYGFTDPVIWGMSVFQCHLLSHEDKGMRAKVVCVPSLVPSAARSQ